MDGGYVAEQGTDEYTRSIVIKVTGWESTPNHYYNVTVSARINYGQGGTTGYELDEDVTLRFFLGRWQRRSWSDRNIASTWDKYEGQDGWKRTDDINNQGGFRRTQYETPFELVVPRNRGSAAITKTYQVYDYYGPAMFSAPMLENHWRGNVDINSFVLYKPPNVSLPDYGWTDIWKGAYHPGGNQQQAISFNAALVPSSSGSIILGAVGHLWKQLYAQNTTISSSARIKKKEITALPDSFDIFFDQLKSVSYRWKHDEDVKRHCGFILDEVGYALDAAGIDKDEFAGYVQFDPKDHLSDGGLRYEEFIAINTDQIQKLKKRVSELETLVEELERERNED